MADEIERKFLVLGSGWRDGTVRSHDIRQAYLLHGEASSVRIRVKNASDATLTIKSGKAGLRRLEFEYAIPAEDAVALLDMRTGGLIEKVRHEVPRGGLTWEIDVFRGENEGLVIAEVELEREDQAFERPEWLGQEITGDARYYNASLSAKPFAKW